MIRERIPADCESHPLTVQAEVTSVEGIGEQDESLRGISNGGEGHWEDCLDTRAAVPYLGHSMSPIMHCGAADNQ